MHITHKYARLHEMYENKNVDIKFSAFIGYAQYRKIEMYHKSSTDFISIFDLNGWTIMII